MTDTQKREEKAELLLAYQEAEDNLSHLRQKAHRIATPFATVAAWLKHLGSFDKKPTYGVVITERNLSIAEALRGKLDLDEVLALTQEINAAEDLLGELKHRKEKLKLR